MIDTQEQALAEAEARKSASPAERPSQTGRTINVVGKHVGLSVDEQTRFVGCLLAVGLEIVPTANYEVLKQSHAECAAALESAKNGLVAAHDIFLLKQVGVGLLPCLDYTLKLIDSALANARKLMEGVVTETAVCVHCGQTQYKHGLHNECYLFNRSPAVPEVPCKEECVQLRETQFHRGDCPNLPAAQTVPIPEDLQYLYEITDSKIMAFRSIPFVPVRQLIERIARAEATVAELNRELRQERGLKALLANGNPPTGNPDFDEVLATHPIAEMIQRGWLPGIAGFDDLPALESAICRFYKVQTIAEAMNPPWPFARRYRKGIVKK